MAERRDRTRTISGDKPAADAPMAAIGLTVLHYPNPGLLGFSVPIVRELRIGREQDKDIDLSLSDDEAVSRRHAVIVAEGEQHVLRDADSKNGTFVNGARVREAVLTPGDIVRIGETLFQYGPLADAGREDKGELLLGRSPAMLRLRADIDTFAPSDISVLILGETGTGKELVARRLHERSGRSGAFVALNCAAVPESLFESYLFGHKKGAFTGATADAPGFFGEAHGGSLFLDEVGELPAALQPKLLRVLETHEYTPVGATEAKRTDARVISATNADVRARASFRPDLYARLAGAVLQLPTLRSRKGDIPLLARHFFQHFAPDRPIQWSAALVESLLLHPWTMNVRELRIVIQRLAVSGEQGSAESLLRGFLSAPVETSSAPRRELPAVTETELRDALAACKGNIVQVATRLGRDRKQIYRWLKKYKLAAESFRG